MWNQNLLAYLDSLHATYLQILFDDKYSVLVAFSQSAGCGWKQTKPEQDALFLSAEG